jgi:hypothetical protein
MEHPMQKFEAQPNLALLAALLEPNLRHAQNGLIDKCIWPVDHDSMVALIEPMG